MNTTQKSFKSTFSPEERIQQSQLALQKYPDHVPVIVEKYNKCKLQQLQKTLHLIRKEVIVPAFKMQLQQSLNISKNQALFIFCKKTIITECQNFEQLYLKYKDPIDGFLYLYYTDIDPFGF